MSKQKINIPALGAFLGIIAAVAAGLLSLVYVSTAEAIALNQQEKTNQALKQVLPPFDEIAPVETDQPLESEDGWPVNFYAAKKDGKLIGYAGEIITPEGFSGNITVMAGLEEDGTIRTVIVTQNMETPGLGTVVTDRKLQKSIVDLFKGGGDKVGLAPNPLLDQYAGRKGDGERWMVSQDGGEIDGKTGATITSRAVCVAVHAISKTCVDNAAKLGGTE